MPSQLLQNPTSITFKGWNKTLTLLKRLSSMIWEAKVIKNIVNILAKFYLVVNALLSGQQKLSGQIFFVRVLMPSIFCLYFFLSIGPLISCLSNCCPYFCPIVQQGHGTYFRNILKLLRNIMGLNNHNLSHKTLKQVSKHSTQNSIS